MLYTYACLGRLPPIVGKYSFSFNVLARSYHMTNSSIAALGECPHDAAPFTSSHCVEDVFLGVLCSAGSPNHRQNAVARANSTTNGQLALDGIRFNDQTRYAGCGFAS